MRVHLTGRLCIEYGTRVIREPAFPGRQGRLAFAFLVLAAGRPVRRDELAEVLWPGALPRAWEAGLSSILSKLRALIERAGGRGALPAGLGAVQLLLPRYAWVDLDRAAVLVETAEAAIARAALDEAWNAAFLSAAVHRRPFLADERSPWAEGVRERMRGDLVRALEVMCDVRLARGEAPQAAMAADEIVQLEPFRETGYQRLMRAHADGGNRAEALRVYARCRRTLSEELGVDPSPPTEAVYLRILRA